MPKPLRRAGVMGWPIDHSLSPRLHRFWLKAYRLEGAYDAYAVRPDGLADTLRSLAAQGLCGVNLTIPHKETALTLMDALSPEASRIGAVNLVSVDPQGRLCGHNTDAFGFAQNLLSCGFERTRGTAVVLGAGGACRAVLVALQDMGFTTIVLANRTQARAETAAQALSSPSCPIHVVAWDDLSEALSVADLLVNTTPLGMAGQPEIVLDLAPLPQTASVADVVYAPLDTTLLRRSRARGLKTIDGLGMLLHQARPSFKAFFGQDPDVSQALREAVLKEVG
ncbi:MAG: shikimate dehydrogenase [Alphaproteobacteria bacterium]|nr:shikimate dehydrogenase [Alphaproteobacteria bacterium]